MSLVVWRIVQRKFARTAFEGEGARRFGGRWNSPRHPVVYTAQSQSLAALEILVHIDSETFLQNYLVIPVTLQQDLILSVDRARLPKNWAEYPAPNETRRLGDEWVTKGQSPVFQVPSAVITAESNFLLNPAHPGFPRLIIGNPVKFNIDPRLIHRP